MKIVFVAVFVVYSALHKNILIIKTIYGNVQDVTSISVENAGRFLATVFVYSLTVAIICFTKNVQN